MLSQNRERVSVHPLILTCLAMFAFAANSVLCRLALGGQLIDPASYTTIRLVSGAVVLAVLLSLRSGGLKRPVINGISSAALFLYAVCFSFAYIDLSTASGALILFGSVQLTMIGFGIWSGERLTAIAWSGVILAAFGLIYLLLPGADAPSLTGALLMAFAGLAWGVYSLRGKSKINPTAATTWNFIGTVPLTLIAGVLLPGAVHITAAGLLLAAVAGGFASAVGYIIWYSALPYLGPSRAATVQLSVPIIAAFGGILFVGESLTLQLIIAGLATLSGIAMVINSKRITIREEA